MKVTVPRAAVATVPSQLRFRVAPLRRPLIVGAGGQRNEQRDENEQVRRSREMSLCHGENLDSE